MIWYISRNYRNKTSAGNKAKTDIEAIMQSMGFKNASFKQTNYKNPLLHFLMTLLDVLKTPFSIHKGDILFIQYPLKKYFAFLCYLIHLREAKIAIIIHDLGSFRRKALTIQQEIYRLSHADYIIAHNDNMKHWLIYHGCKIPIGIIEIFDYLSSGSHILQKKKEVDFNILYAGALSHRKNTFLYEAGNYAKNYYYTLYGKGFEQEKACHPEKFICKGFTPSDQLIATSRGDFGLVWDGNSTTECAGDWGNYLKYNNPHKTSLYIRCGLPLIVWKQSAMATFVKKENIGLCIDSLQNLSVTLQQLQPEVYAVMKQNVEKINKRIAHGYYFKKAAQQAINYLTEASHEKS